MSFHVHWHEGLFLQPHHLQLLQRSVFEQTSSVFRVVHPYAQGILEARLSSDELAAFRLRFERLVVMMASGLVVDYPATAELPTLDLKPLFSTGASTFDIHLGIPLWQPKRANAFDVGQPADPRVKLLYKPVEATVTDENTGENAKPVLLRRINARLLGPGDDASDMETLPVLRLVRATGEALGVPQVDSEYVAPSVFLSASPTLYSRVRDIVAAVQASRDELSVQVTRGGLSLETLRGAQFEQLLRLQTLNRFSARMGSLLAAPSITPFTWYLELRDLHAELSALHPDRDTFEVEDYDHSALYPVFESLDKKIRTYLRGTVSATFLKLDFTTEPGVRAVAFTDEHLTRPVEYFLAVRSSLDPRQVVAIVEDRDQFKFMPRSMAGLAIRGLGLKEERIPPLQFPAQTGLTYFRVLRTESARVWAQLQQEKAAVIRWPAADSSDFHVILYMTLP